MTRTRTTRKMVTSGLILALGIVLPFLTGQLGSLGQMISPLHIPAFLCGLTCGPVWGAVLGLILPILRSLLFGMPPLVPVAIPMAFELTCYGCLSGLLYGVLKKRLPSAKHILLMLAAMAASMVAGRIIGGAAKAVVMGISGSSYSMKAFVAAYVTGTLPGAVIHLLVVPAIVVAIEKAKLV